ncbi:MAG: hypothetical protein ACYDC5_00770 [Candidatus Dormibacteria bacterium]
MAAEALQPFVRDTRARGRRPPEQCHFKLLQVGARGSRVFYQDREPAAIAWTATRNSPGSICLGGTKKLEQLERIADHVLLAERSELLVFTD